MTQKLLREDFQVIGIDNMNSYYDILLKENRLKSLKENENFKFYKINLEDKDNLKKIFQVYKFDIVINLAAQAGVRYSAKNPSAYYDSNIVGFLNVIGLSKDFSSKFIYASSSSVYGAEINIPYRESIKKVSPLSLYGITKKVNEDIADFFHSEFKFQSYGLRFFSVYGPFGRPDMAYYKFSESIRRGHPITVYNRGLMSRDMTFIDDICDGILNAIGLDINAHEIFNLGNSNPIKLNYLINFLENFFNKKATINFEESQGEVMHTFADISKSKKILGFSPKVSFEDGMEIFLKWFCNYYSFNE